MCEKMSPKIYHFEPFVCYAEPHALLYLLAITTTSISIHMYVEVEVIVDII